MSDKIYSLIPLCLFWLVALIVSSILVRRTGLSKHPLNTAKYSILSMNKKIEDFSSSSRRLEKDDKKRAMETRIRFAEAKRLSHILKDVKKAHDALSVFCYDNRLNKESAQTLESIDKISDLMHRFSKGSFKTAKDYNRALDSLVSESSKTVKLIEAAVQ